MNKPIDDFCLQVKEVKKLNDIYKYNERVLARGIDISGVLRAQIVFVVSALDHYIHNVILYEALNILKNNKPHSPSFGKLTLGFNSVALLINNDVATDFLVLVEQEIKHNLGWKSFQQPDKIAEALQIICEKKIWNEVAPLMGKSSNDIKEQLKLIVKRRDSIAHEADFDIVNQCQYSINSIDVSNAVNFIISLVFIIDSVVFCYAYDNTMAHKEFIK